MRTMPVNLLPSTTASEAREGGFALPAALAVLVLLSALVVTVYANAMASFRSGDIDLRKARSHFAAEAGAESAMAQLADMLEDAVLEDAELTGITTPTMTGFQFDSFSILRVGGVQDERITDGPFAGLYSLTQVVDIYSEASDPDGHSSAVMVTAKAQAIPIFQFGVFYERDLEIHNGANMWFAGWVHSNGNVYLNSGAQQYFEDLITTPNKVFWDRKDSHEVFNGTYIDDASGNAVLLDFDSRSEPDPNDFRAESDANFDNRLQTDAYAVDSLRVPLPSGVPPEAVLDERSMADTPLEVQAKMAWKSDWYIEVPLDELANPNDLCDEMIEVRDDPTKVVPSSSDCADIFTLQYNAFYDYKEGAYVDVIDVDISELFDWTGTDVTRTTRILYIWFSGTSGSDYPAVRLTEGDDLGGPITVATKHPLYVLGDYNDGAIWRPSALMGDGITLLSNSWVDSQHRPGGTGGGLSGATTTRYYMAVLAGHTPTPSDHEVTGTNSSYGGGLENYLRFLENWSGDTALYRGSLVSLHYSAQADGAWSYGYYYTAPNRDWAFDTRFRDPANLPPGTPVVGNVLHTAFRPVH